MSKRKPTPKSIQYRGAKYVMANDHVSALLDKHIDNFLDEVAREYGLVIDSSGRLDDDINTFVLDAGDALERAGALLIKRYKKKGS